ncbi:60S acidic ribosomal protein P0-like [Bactrocera tryoni]|uniref:60S acidic ribosomal protein P0-like n=1 Tax=Bactrocera tryoni TaxID=59916 RepID=UPI001A96CD42|nr:60S acidic ribosomal protein P0-like [Bactrocera tryoni]
MLLPLRIPGIKNLLAIGVATEVDFKEAVTIKEFIKDSRKFVAAAASAPVAGVVAAAEKKEEAKKEESECKEEDDMGFGLFD